MLKQIIFSIFTIFLLTSCASPKLEQKEFKLISFGKSRMAVPKKANITLKDGQYFGYAGCNGMGGKYDMDGEKIKFHSGMSTMIACPDMRLETKFRQLLEKVNNYKIEKDLLKLNQDENTLLIFKKL